MTTRFHKTDIDGVVALQSRHGKNVLGYMDHDVFKNEIEDKGFCLLPHMRIGTNDNKAIDTVRAMLARRRGISPRMMYMLNRDPFSLYGANIAWLDEEGQSPRNTYERVAGLHGEDVANSAWSGGRLWQHKRGALPLYTNTYRPINDGAAYEMRIIDETDVMNVDAKITFDASLLAYLCKYTIILRSGVPTTVRGYDVARMLVAWRMNPRHLGTIDRSLLKRMRRDNVRFVDGNNCNLCSSNVSSDFVLTQSVQPKEPGAARARCKTIMRPLTTDDVIKAGWPHDEDIPSLEGIFVCTRPSHRALRVDLRWMYNAKCWFHARETFPFNSTVHTDNMDAICSALESMQYMQKRLECIKSAVMNVP